MKPLVAHRYDSGLSQIELAEHASTNSMMVYKLESGKTAPGNAKLHVVHGIATALGVHPSQIEEFAPYFDFDGLASGEVDA